MEDGSIKGCGSNYLGQLGLGDTTDRTSPVNHPLTGVMDIVCGNYTFFLMEDGTIKCCGYNYYGQLGLGDTTDRTSPVDHPLTGVRDIVCGAEHTFFIMEDGTIKCCGHNGSGQLGLGDTTNRTSPVNHPLTGVKDIVCGRDHTFFIMEDGSIKGCGRNNYGNLGVGNTSYQKVPVNIPVNGVKDIKKSDTFPPPIMKILIKSNNKVYSYLDNEIVEVALGDDVNDQIFKNYGFDDISVIPIEQLHQLGDEIEVLVWSEKFYRPNIKQDVDSFKPVDIENTTLLAFTLSDKRLSMVRYIPEHELYYALSSDGLNFYSKASGQWKKVYDLYTEGMTKRQVEALTKDEISEIFVPGQLFVKAALKTHNPNSTPYIDEIAVKLPVSYRTGGWYLHTHLNQFNTLDWKQINSVTISQIQPEGTDIRYAFSRDNRETWEVFDGEWKKISLSDIGILGMTKEQVESLTPEQWDPIIWDNELDVLDVCVYLFTQNQGASPVVDHIIFDYTKIATPVESKIITVPVPDLGYRNVLVEDEYTLKVAEGLAYDDVEVDYRFYTTPDRIKLRPLDVGTIIGGQQSNIYAFEVVNTFEQQTYDVTLRASKNGQLAKAYNTYCLLPDATRDTEKTRVEMSLYTGDDFSPVYPLTFRLSPGEKRIVYIRMKPTITTVGYDVFQIILSGCPV